MADLRVALDELKEESDSGELAAPARVASRWSGRRVAAVALALLAVLAAAGAVAWRWRSPPALELHLTPITSSPGVEQNPALSPEGDRVAFSWEGEKFNNWDIYVQVIGAGAPLRLTTHPGEDYRPVWSPDGRYIAFSRWGSDDGPFVVPALGGQERRISRSGDPCDWTPDSKQIVLCDEYALVMVALDSGERTPMLDQHDARRTFSYASLSPDGTQLAFVDGPAGASAVQALHVVPFAGTKTSLQSARRLTAGSEGIFGLAWSADSRTIYYSSDRTGIPRMWRTSADGRRGPDAVTGPGDDVSGVSIARRTGRMAYGHLALDINLRRLPLRRSNGLPSIVPDAPMDRLIVSSRRDHMPEYSPDGKKIAFVSDRSSTSEIYVADADGRNTVQLTESHGPANLWPRWSPDGQRVVFGSRPGGNPDVYEVSVTGGPARRVTADPAVDFWPSYSSDGAWIYFSSDRQRTPSTWTIWKIPALGGNTTVTRLPLEGALTTRESPDGQFLYYSRVDQDGIWRFPLRARQAVRIIHAAIARDWTLALSGIYFREPTVPEIKYYSFATQTVSIVGAPPAKFAVHSGLAVSPDENWLVFPRYDQVVGDIMLVENYR